MKKVITIAALVLGACSPMNRDALTQYCPVEEYPTAASFTSISPGVGCHMAFAQDTGIYYMWEDGAWNQVVGANFTGNLAVTGNVSISGNLTGGGSFATKSYGLGDIGTTDLHYMAGYYMHQDAEMVLTNASAVDNFGTANNGYGAHAFFVAKGDGATDSGDTSDLTVTVSGTSVTDAGVRTPADSEVIVGTGAATSGCTAAIAASLAENSYCETAKKWNGQVTYTLTSAGGATFNISGNIGFAKYEDYGNRDFTVTDFEVVYHAGANETDFGIRLLLHSTAGWDYDDAAFDPGGTAIVSLDTDYSTDDEFDSGEYGAYKRAGLSQAVDGDNLEGVIIEVSAPVNNSIRNLDAHIGVEF